MADHCPQKADTVSKAAVKAVWSGLSVAVTGVRGMLAGPRSAARAERCSAAAIGMAKAASKRSCGFAEGVMLLEQEESARLLGARGAE